jgi:hypothetical protein
MNTGTAIGATFLFALWLTVAEQQIKIGPAPIPDGTTWTLVKGKQYISGIRDEEDPGYLTESLCMKHGEYWAKFQPRKFDWYVAYYCKPVYPLPLPETGRKLGVKEREKQNGWS